MSHVTSGHRQKFLLEYEVQLQPSVKFDAGTLFEAVGGNDPYESKVKVQSLDPGDSSVFSCKREMLKELTALEAHVLLPVKPVRNRLKIYRDEKWFKEIPVITENKRVIVQDKVEGIVKFKGVVKEYGPGIRFIVEMQDGTDPIKRQQCVSINDIRLLDNGDVLHAPNNPFVAPKLPSKKKSVPPTSHDVCYPTPPASSANLAPQKESCPIQVNERVVWVSDHGPEYGTVRWLGHLPDTSPDLMVGVEFDNRVGTGTGRYRDRQLFEAKLGHASLVPLLGLLRADDYMCEQDAMDHHNLSSHRGRTEPWMKVDPTRNDFRSQDLDRSYAPGCHPSDRIDNRVDQGGSNDGLAASYPYNQQLLPSRCPRPEPEEDQGACHVEPQGGSSARKSSSRERAVPNEEEEGVPLGKDDLKILTGRKKGIQGHHNSCYLDATLFAMFACTNVFDIMLHRTKKLQDIKRYDEVRRVLRDEIVFPLRTERYVKHGNVMKLRCLLDELGSVSGLTSEEKDPEEFLSSLLQILGVAPFVTLSSGQNTHLYQLFVQKDKYLEIPTVQQVFHQSIYESNIKLKEVPTQLIIQMPRFGKQFKVYTYIVPSLKLDVTDILEDYPRSCFVCGRLATYECRHCFRADIGLEGIGYCGQCCSTVHHHKERRDHKHDKLDVKQGYEGNPVSRIYMDLFAVVCIETSHYVCFVKCGDEEDAPWCFFDSMADREGGEDGQNIPEVTEFRDFPRYVNDAGTNFLRNIVDEKQLGVMARRLVCDAYMCLYKNKTVSQYR